MSEPTRINHFGKIVSSQWINTSPFCNLMCWHWKLTLTKSAIKGTRPGQVQGNNEWDVDIITIIVMGTLASQITSLTIVYSTVYSGADQRKHQRSASLAFVRGIHRGPVNIPHQWPVTRKMFPFDDVIMSWPLAEGLIKCIFSSTISLQRGIKLFSIVSTNEQTRYND